MKPCPSGEDINLRRIDSPDLLIASSSRTMSGSSVCVPLLCLLYFCSACYISNCPVGGRRSLTDAPSRKCMACGPGNKGRCFGPSICCGAGLGCLVGSPETLTCMEENLLPGPCETGGTSCGAEGGLCAAPGVCCDSVSCSADPLCSAEEEISDGNVPMRILQLRIISGTHQ